MIVGVTRHGRALYGMGDLDPMGIISPSRDQLDAETDALLARISQLGADFNSDESYPNSVTQELLGRWNAFVNAVNSWDSGPRFLAHVLGTTWRDELIAYQQKFNSFVQEFRDSAVAVTTPVFTFNPPPSTVDKLIDAGGNAVNKIGDAAGKVADKALKPVSDAISTIETVAIVGGLAAVGFIFYLTFETGRTARSIAPRLLR